jgi:hypothetical protein
VKLPEPLSVIACRQEIKRYHEEQTHEKGRIDRGKSLKKRRATVLHKPPDGRTVRAHGMLQDDQNHKRNAEILDVK